MQHCCSPGPRGAGVRVAAIDPLGDWRTHLCPCAHSVTIHTLHSSALEMSTLCNATCLRLIMILIMDASDFSRFDIVSRTNVDWCLMSLPFYNQHKDQVHQFFPQTLLEEPLLYGSVVVINQTGPFILRLFHS